MRSVLLFLCLCALYAFSTELVAPLELEYVVGHAYTYAYANTMNTAGSQQDISGSQNQNSVIYTSGEVTLLALQAATVSGKPGMWLSMTFAGMTMKVSQDGGKTFNDTDHATLLDMLSQPFYFVHGTQGEVLLSKYNQNETADVLNFKLGIASRLHNVLSSSPTYTTEESDASGTGRVQYTVTPASGNSYIDKVKAIPKEKITHPDLLGSLSVSRTTQSTIIHDSTKKVFTSTSHSDKITLDKTQWALDPNLTNVTSTYSKTDSDINSDHSSSLKLIRVTPAPHVSSQHVILLDSGNLTQSSSLLPREEEDIPTAYEVTEQDVIAAVRSLEQDPTNPAVYKQLIALMAEDIEDKASGVVNALLLQQGTVIQARDAVVSSFAAVGSPSAQVYLSTILYNVNSLFSTADITSALLSCTMLPNPQVHVINAVSNISSNEEHELRGQATLVLGAMVHKMSISSAGSNLLAHAINARLIHQMKNTTEIGMTVLYAHALGNAGLTTSLSYVAHYLDHDSPLVREAATTALRKMEPTEATDLLLMMVSTDPDEGVRVAAVNGLTLREFSTNHTILLKTAFLTEKDPVVSKSIANLLEKKQSVAGQFDGMKANKDPEYSIGSGAAGKPITYNGEKTWGKTVGGKDASASMNIALTYGGSANIFPVQLGGKVKASMGASVTVFSYSLDIMDAYVLVKEDLGKPLESRMYLQVVSDVLLDMAIIGKKSTSSSLAVADPPCAPSNKTFGQHSKQFFNIQHTVHVYGIPITFGISATGTYGFVAEGEFCAADGKAFGGIGPGAWIDATGSAAVSILLVKAGVELNVNLIKVTLLPNVNVALVANKACLTLSHEESSLAGNLGVFYQLKKCKWFKCSWGDKHSATLFGWRGLTIGKGDLFNFCRDLYKPPSLVAY